jgi:FkbM family methyltransferase
MPSSDALPAIRRPSLRERLVGFGLRRYPLLSGCGSLANHRLLRSLAGSRPGLVWAAGPAGAMAVPPEDWVGRAVLLAGDLDRKITQLCRRLLAAGDHAIDVGANIGLVTTTMAARVGPQGRVLAVEPNPVNLRLLHATIARAGLSQVAVHACALGSADGELALHVPAGNSGAASLLSLPGKTLVDEPVVPVRRLDGIVEAGCPIALMKIDVEGFEDEVLSGGSGLLGGGAVDAIVLERHRVGLPADDPALGRLLQWGYTLYAVPRCLLRLRLQRLDARSPVPPGCNDYLAVRASTRAGSIAAALAS